MLIIISFPLFCQGIILKFSMYWLYIILHRAHADIIYIKYLHCVYHIFLVYNYLYSEREYISYSISISTLQKRCTLLQVRCISVALQQKLYNPIILTKYQQKKNRHFWRLSCLFKRCFIFQSFQVC